MSVTAADGRTVALLHTRCGALATPEPAATSGLLDGRAVATGIRPNRRSPEPGAFLVLYSSAEARLAEGSDNGGNSPPMNPSLRGGFARSKALRSKTMAKKKAGGGAATHAGTNFQNRFAAWAAVQILGEVASAL